MLLVGYDDWVVGVVVVGVVAEVVGIVSSTVVSLRCACSLRSLSTGLT